MNPQPDVARSFFVGGEWLYYKFYSGPKTADNLLAEVIRPLAAQFLAGGIIDKWFFIRFSDPKLHVRVRFHLLQPSRMGELIVALHDAVKPLVDDDLIAKVMVDTYQREIERYGPRTMDLSETLFFHDSVMQVQVLELIRGDQGENLRWQFGLKAVDAFLEDFGLDLAQKEEQLSGMRENFSREFGGGKGLKVMLDTKFRREKQAVQKVLGEGAEAQEAWGVISGFLQVRSQVNLGLAAEYRRLLGAGDGTPPQREFLASHIHMMLNRLFRTRQRVHELVIYDFLHRQYKSLLARQKTK